MAIPRARSGEEGVSAGVPVLPSHTLVHVYLERSARGHFDSAEDCAAFVQEMFMSLHRITGYQFLPQADGSALFTIPVARWGDFANVVENCGVFIGERQ